MESGTSKISWFFQPKDVKTDFDGAWAQAIGCSPNDVKCLQSKEPRELLIPPISSWGEPAALFRHPLYPYLTVGPVIDNTLYGLRDVPIALVESGQAAKVPLLLGANKNEGSIFAWMTAVYLQERGASYSKEHSPENNADVQYLANREFGSKDAPQILKAYPSSEFSVPVPFARTRYHREVSRMVRDAVFMCSNRALASQWASQGLDAFMYVFAFDLGIVDDVVGLGDFHSSEVPFVFRSANSSKILRSARAVQRMTDIISCQWSSFAYSGNPNGLDTPAPNCNDVHGHVEKWPKFDDADRHFYSLQEVPKAVPIKPGNMYPHDEFPSDERCDVWDKALTPWRPKAHHVEIKSEMLLV
jgi:para-nitrobenzyl esterase